MRYATLLLILLLAGCKTELFANLPEQEANEMVAVLLEHNLAASKQVHKDGSRGLLVERTDFAPAVEVLRNAGYPKPQFATIGEVFRSSGLVASPMEERARFLWALGQELSRTLCEIDGVVTARVQVVLPNDDLLTRSPTASSASVFILYRPESNIDKLIPQVKELVASSVEGLAYDRVSVISVQAAAPHVVSMTVGQTDDSAGFAVFLIPLVVAGLLLTRYGRSILTAGVAQARERIRPGRGPDASRPS